MSGNDGWMRWFHLIFLPCLTSRLNFVASPAQQSQTVITHSLRFPCSLACSDCRETRGNTESQQRVWSLPFTLDPLFTPSIITIHTLCPFYYLSGTSQICPVSLTSYSAFPVSLTQRLTLLISPPRLDTLDNGGNVLRLSGCMAAFERISQYLAALSRFLMLPRRSLTIRWRISIVSSALSLRKKHNG